MKATLSGLGVWIWELGACGPSVLSLGNWARDHGVSWVVVKCGEDSSNGQLTEEVVRRVRSTGVECGAWWYCRPRAYASQIAMLKRMADLGVRHFVMDAEVEWDSPDQRVEAGQFATQIRAALGDDAFLADAPWALPVSHKAPFPYEEFGQVMDARMPQFYWATTREAQASFLDRCDAEWGKHEFKRERICPTGCLVDYSGAKHRPASELSGFLLRYADRPLRSLWSWQHLNQKEWWAIKDATSLPDIPDASLPNPLAGTPPAGLVIPGENDGEDPKEPSA